VKKLTQKASTMLKKEPILLRPTAPAKIFGDLHGQLRDLLLFLHHYGFPSYEGPSFVFNGDWVDRGQHQVELLLLVFSLKLAFPEKVFLVRGNHEDGLVNSNMKDLGFLNSLNGAFGAVHGAALHESISRTFDWLSLAALIDDRILVVHGGIGRGDWTFGRLEKVTRPVTHLAMLKNPMVYNILWSDPVDEDRGQSFGAHASHRDNKAGVIQSFSYDVTEAFCEMNRIAMVVRSHESIKKGAGYEIMHGGKLATVFSARDYEGQENDGSILSIEQHRQEGSLDDDDYTLVVRPQQIWSLMKKSSRRGVKR